MEPRTRKTGEIVPHAKIEEAIRVRYRTSRYQTVLNAWRHTLFSKHNVDTRVVPGRGLEFLAENQRTGEAEHDFASAYRKTRKALRRVSAVQAHTLTEQERAEHTHKSRYIAQAAAAMQQSRKALPVPPATVSNPQRQISEPDADS